jgi:hypothetical protein
MAIGNVPGDAIASAVVDTLTDLVSAGSFGVVSVARTGPTSYRVTLSSPTDADACMCVVEIDGGAPTVINATPVSSTVWDVDWAPVAAGGLTSVTGLAPVQATTAGTAVVVSFISGTAPGQVLTWSGAAWAPAAPAPAAPAPVTFPVFIATTSATPDYGPAVFLTTNATAPSSAFFYLSTAGDVGAFHLANSIGLLFTTWNTLPATGPGYYEAFPGGFVGLPTGWYRIGASKMAGPGSIELLGVRIVP